MAYQTGSASSPSGLLDALRTFAVAQGWTQNAWAEVTTGNFWLNLSKGGHYVNFYGQNAAGTISLQGATSYNSGAAYNAQPGRISTNEWSISNDLTGPYVGHHFFSGTNHVHVVCQVASGRYVHFGFGTLTKYGAYTGGEYVFGTHWYLNSTTYSGASTSNLHSVPFDADYVGSGAAFSMVRFAEAGASVANWLRFRTTMADGFAVGYSRPGSANSLSMDLVRRQPNTFNGLSVLLPIHCWAARTDGLVSILGAPPEMKQIDISYHAHGETLTLGTDEWLVFPLKAKGPDLSDGSSASGNFGLAYKKVV